MKADFTKSLDEGVIIFFLVWRCFQSGMLLVYFWIKKMCPTETGNEHYWGSKFAWSKCNYIKKNKQNKITKQIKKKGFDFV